MEVSYCCTGPVQLVTKSSCKNTLQLMSPRQILAKQRACQVQNPKSLRAFQPGVPVGCRGNLSLRDGGWVG
jgi:hypothetical protein